MDDGGLVAESRFNVQVTHSERLMADIDHILRRSGFGIGGIDAFGIAIGPGSFTGLRVGLSTMKGIVYATRRPLVAVSTLEALAWNFPYCRYQVCPVLDARKREVYTSLYRWNDMEVSPVIGELVCSIDTLLAMIAERTVFLGEGARLYRERIQACLGDKALFAAPQALVPSAAHVAGLCMERARRGAFDDPLTLVPRYLRRSEAEVKSQQSHGKS